MARVEGRDRQRSDRLQLAMNKLHLSRYVLIVSGVFSLLPGCGGSQPPIAEPGAMPQSRTVTQQAGDLIYAGGFDRIYVLTFPEDKLVATIHDGLDHGDLCSDADGNVFVPAHDPNANTAVIDEYAHGATTPTRLVALPNREFGACSIDPTSGSLAATEYDDSGHHGKIAIFKNATGEPQYYRIHASDALTSCGYDNEGNLFAAGAKAPQLWELRVGDPSFKRVRFSFTLGAPERIQWDGSYLTIEEAWHRPAIHRVSISNFKATLVGTTPLRKHGSGRRSMLASWIQGSTVIATAGWRGALLMSWKYPLGGKPTRIDARHHRWMRSVTVSVSPRWNRGKER